MAVKVLYFASLRERLGCAGIELSPAPTTVRAVWHAAAGETPPPAGVLCALNHDYADWEAPVRDGDEVAFFPPVTGG